jgi:hypothetical protein
VKPLSEWPNDVLRDCLFTQDEDSPRYYWDEKSPVSQREALAELLRRERGRCARACREVAIFLRANGMAEIVHATEACAAAIGELQ